MPTAKELTETVNAGASFLDKKAPGWWLNIDIETLDVASSTSCVTAHGLKTGYYLLSQSILGIDHEVSAELGFLVNEDDLSMTEIDSRYSALTDLWTALIKERRSSSSGASDHS